MRNLLLLLVLISAVAAEEIPLSTQKMKLLEFQKKQVKEDLNKNEKSWLNPFTLSASINRNKTPSLSKYDIKNISLNINQDLFRSGGIFYTISQAKSLANVNLLSIDKQEALYLKNAYTLLVQIKRDRLKLQQNELTLKNSEIDLFIIQAKYKVGSADITDLNRAVLNRDSAKTQTIIIRNFLQNEEFELKKIIGKKSIDAINLPEFVLLSKEQYLKQNLELLEYKSKYKNSEDNLKVTRSSYLPKLTFNGSISYNEYSNINRDGSNYSYGLTLSMPLDIKTKSTIESVKLQSLQIKTGASDRHLELEQEYEKHLYTIGNFKDKIDIANNTYDTYKKLHEFTKSQVSVGMKSSYDLESLTNSMEIQKLEVAIQKYNIIIEKITLFFDVKHKRS